MTADAAGTANPATTTHTTTTTKAPALAWRDVRVAYAPRARSTEPVVAVDGVSLAVARGSTVGIAGESGCGKYDPGTFGPCGCFPGPPGWTVRLRSRARTS